MSHFVYSRIKAEDNVEDDSDEYNSVRSIAINAVSLQNDSTGT